MEYQKLYHQFPPQWDENSEILILGSFPSVNSLLAEEAIHAALWDYAEKNDIKIEGLEKPKADIHDEE